MLPIRITIPVVTLVVATLIGNSCYAQNDSTKASVQDIPLKYIKALSAKTDKYSNRVSSETEKTLAKLSKWENKIHGLLQKADPAADAKLFGPGKLTFSSMLQKLKDGQALEEKYKAQYDSYRDKLTVNIKYISSKKDSLDAKYLQPLKKAGEEQKELDQNITQSEAAEKLIRERKKELMAEAMKALGKSKYFSKINKEAYYYAATLKNYKELFHDPVKAEKEAVAILKRIPAFAKFMKQNSALSSLFGGGSTPGTQSIAGLQTRAQVNALIQNRIAQGGPNAGAIASQNMQAAQAQLQSLKSKILKAGGGSSNQDLPDFKPNNQRSKTFKQRLEFGSNIQFGKPNRFSTSVADLGLSLGYKLNDKSTVGIGIAYKLGYGSLQKLRISSEGIGVRSYLDWKLKKQFFISGGYEMNHNATFTSLRTLQEHDAWQSSGLIGISKKIKIKTKFTKGTKLQLLYDMLYKQHVVQTQPIIFRIGYDLK